MWELEKSQDGVDVYTALRTGERFKSFKAKTTVHASSEEVVKVLEDVKKYVDWFAYTKRARLIEANPQEKFVYMETRFPWPFTNEDMIYKMTVTTDTGATVRVGLQGVPNYLPAVDGVSRMKKADGYLLLKPVANQTEITYVMHSELGGDIPAWMANQYIFELPLQTLSNLKHRFDQ
jgi:hypothetical protein